MRSHSCRGADASETRFASTLTGPCPPEGISSPGHVAPTHRSEQARVSSTSPRLEDPCAESSSSIAPDDSVPASSTPAPSCHTTGAPGVNCRMASTSRIDVRVRCSPRMIFSLASALASGGAGPASTAAAREATRLALPTTRNTLPQALRRPAQPDGPAVLVTEPIRAASPGAAACRGTDRPRELPPRPGPRGSLGQNAQVTSAEMVTVSAPSSQGFENQTTTRARPGTEKSTRRTFETV
jgi:hypothetical protein